MCVVQKCILSNVTGCLSSYTVCVSTYPEAIVTLDNDISLGPNDYLQFVVFLGGILGENFHYSNCLFSFSLSLSLFFFYSDWCRVVKEFENGDKTPDSSATSNTSSPCTDHKIIYYKNKSASTPGIYFV